MSVILFVLAILAFMAGSFVGMTIHQSAFSLMFADALLLWVISAVLLVGSAIVDGLNDLRRLVKQATPVPLPDPARREFQVWRDKQKRRDKAIQDACAH